MREHEFDIRIDYPNESPTGRMWIGHYYKCRACGVEVGHPEHLVVGTRECPGAAL